MSELVGKLVLYTPVDAAADQMAKKYIHDSLPPFLSGSKRMARTYSVSKILYNLLLFDRVALVGC